MRKIWTSLTPLISPFWSMARSLQIIAESVSVLRELYEMELRMSRKKLASLRAYFERHPRRLRGGLRERKIQAGPGGVTEGL